MEIRVKRLPPTDDHDAQKWVRLLGFVEGSPECTWKTRTVNLAAVVSGSRTLEAEAARLRADVEEYYNRWLALADLPEEL
jgi:hypothetical protein